MANDQTRTLSNPKGSVKLLELSLEHDVNSPEACLEAYNTALAYIEDMSGCQVYEQRPGVSVLVQVDHDLAGDIELIGYSLANSICLGLKRQFGDSSPAVIAKIRWAH